MLITQQAGTVSADSALPTWESIFKSQVDPNKKTISDDFKTNLGGLNGRVTSGKTWSTLGTTGAYLTVYDGYIAQNTAGNSRALLPHAKSGKVCQIVEWREGYIGLLIRAADATNYHQIVLNSTGLFYTKVVASVSTTLASTGITMTVGETYALGVEWTETNIKIYIDDVLAAEVNDTDLAANTNIGAVVSGTTNKIFELVAR